MGGTGGYPPRSHCATSPNAYLSSPLANFALLKPLWGRGGYPPQCTECKPRKRSVSVAKWLSYECRSDSGGLPR
ncbi:hypothetical protein ABLL_P1_0002 (plasmid) [Arcobacter sp. L]|nr:hypothetical protein ABLL_P1_0002 [Arcobacter sp. L]